MGNKRPLQSKTLWFNVLSTISIIGAALLAEPTFLEYIGTHAAIAIAAVNVVNIILRVYTNTGIAIPEDK